MVVLLGDSGFWVLVCGIATCGYFLGAELRVCHLLGLALLGLGGFADFLGNLVWCEVDAV